MIDNKTYFQSVIAYTHRNPVHHGFCNRLNEWNYSSYCEIKENKSQLIETTKLFKIFEGIEGFLAFHQLALEKYKEQLIGDI